MGGVCTAHSDSRAPSQSAIEIQETFLSKGDFFGEECVVDRSPHTRSILARGRVSLLVLSNSAFRRLCDPDDMQKANRHASA